MAGLVWLGHRPYDPSTRAFLAPDPLPGIAGQAVAANPYHYAANDPLGLLDPLGLRPLSMAAYQQLREQRQTGLVDRAGQLAGTVGEGIATGLRYVAGGALVATGFVGSLPIIGAPVHPATGTVQAVATMANGDFDPNHIVRNFVNGPTTTAGLGLALIGDARIRYDGQTGMWVATEATTGFGRAGTTYGSTFVTGELDPDENLKHHESIHAEQYARFGGGIIFPILYFWEEHNHPGCENKYEREAGLEDGRYSGPGCN